MRRPQRGWDTGQTCFDGRKGKESPAAQDNDRAPEARGGGGRAVIREQRYKPAKNTL